MFTKLAATQIAKLTPAGKSNLLLAAFPLGVALIARALGEIEALFTDRLRDLAELEMRVLARRGDLDALLAAIAEQEPADDRAWVEVTPQQNPHDIEDEPGWSPATNTAVPVVPQAI